MVMHALYSFNHFQICTCAEIRLTLKVIHQRTFTWGLLIMVLLGPFV